MDRIQADQSIELSSSISIDEAKTWFVNHIEKTSALRIDNNIANQKNIQWEKAAKTFKYNNGEAIAVPINYTKEYYIKYYLDKNKQKLEKGKDPSVKISTNYSDKLLIYKDLNGIFHEEVVRIIPDQDYLVSKNEGIKNTLFDGLIILIQKWGVVFFRYGKQVNDIT